MEKIKLLLSGRQRIENYVRAVEAVGAVAVAEYLPKVDTGYDGLILCGGNDVDPCRFCEQIRGAMDIDRARDERELMLLRAYVEAGKPILGICRGHQLVNVFFGGSLYQHIPEAELHKRFGVMDSVHTVTSEQNSIIRKLYGDKFSVNSAHHQAIKVLGEGLRATAYWNNKYIEAVEHTAMPILGMQWHPERMMLSEARDDTTSGLPIFRYFVELCRIKKL